MADLSTVAGITAARSDLYDKLATGAVSEARADTMERILRGQEALLNLTNGNGKATKE